MDNTQLYKKLNTYKTATTILSIFLTLFLLFQFFNAQPNTIKQQYETMETFSPETMGRAVRSESIGGPVGGVSIVEILGTLVEDGEITQDQLDLILETLKGSR